ncbi:hypothetical protein [Pontibacillus yanchengensis]|uniref:Uncharacterized protein n=1 Tax=Pontibacillus yanchengensis Y32 TaxID=1385514 RepID=A0A0A2TGK3_9BACI|nr:hypothetical protein [Pontibacillus yanchengensis]KGP74704.1 hypothetical protein N782_00695 [Pontibacillus yanchengensis Y32]
MRKWIGIIFFSIVLIGAGWVAYLFFLKDYDTADQQVDEIVDSEFQVEVSEQQTKSSNDQQSQSSTNEDTSKDENLSVSEIKQNHQPAIDKLEQQAQAKIDELAQHALAEYQKKKNNGEDVSYSYFYQKYKEAANRLESNMDSAFNNIYSSMQTKLAENGHSKEAASEVKENYEQMKEQWKQELKDQAMEGF